MPRRIWLLIAIAVISLVGLRAGSLDTGLHMDDFAQRAMVREPAPIARPAWDLYSFSSGDSEDVRALASRGAIPWWSHPQLRLRALRPLSSLTIWVDVKLWGPTAAHVHSLLWWVFMLGAAAWALRAALGLRWALLAVALYALDDAHVFPIAWLANRAALVSCAFGWLALGAYVRHAKGAGPRWPTALWAGLALAGGEYGLCALAFVLSYAALGDPRPLSVRLRSVLPTVLCACGYLLLHRLGGFGAAHSDVYVDPGADPAAFAGAWAERAPALWLDMLTGAPLAWISAFVPRFGGTWLWVGLGTLGLVAAFVRLADPSSDAGPSPSPLPWLLVGAAAALTPVSASFLSERLTVAASLGTHAVFAGVLLRAFDGARAGGVGRRLLFGVIASGVLFGHGVVAARSGLTQQDTLRSYNTAGLSLVAAMPADDTRTADEHWILLTAGDPMMMVYPPQLRAWAGHPKPRRWTVLSLSRQPLTMRRLSKRALELSGPLLDDPLVGFFRSSKDALALGDIVELDGLTAEVTAVDVDGRPRSIVFTFDARLDGPKVRVWSLGTRGFVRYPLAAPGAQMPVPPAIDAIRAAATPD